MAVTFESITTNTGSSSTITVNMPATRPDGDLYIAIIMHDDDDILSTIPTNWNCIGANVDNNSQGPGLGCWWWEGNSEPASYSVSIVLSEGYAAHVIRLSGADTNHPVAGFGIEGAITESANKNAPSINTQADNTFVIRAVSVDFSAVTGVPPTIRAGGLNSGVGFGISTEAGPATAGATGTAQFTHTSNSSVALTLAIRPDRGSISQELASATFYSKGDTADATPEFYHHPTRPDNDLYISLLAQNDNHNIDTKPAGWTERIRETSGTPADDLSFTLWSFTGSSEPSSYTVTVASPPREFISGILRIADGDTTDPIDASSSTTSDGVNTLTAPSVTTTNDNTLVLRILNAKGITIADAANDVPDGTILIYSPDKAAESTIASMIVAVEEGPNPAGATGTFAFDWEGDSVATASTIAINLTSTTGHTLTANDLSSGTPTLDSPTLTQVHVLTGTDLSTTPVLDSPTLTQVHSLSATDLAAGTPVLDSSTLSESHTVTANDLATPAPTLDTPTIAQVHALTGTDLNSGTPVLDSPAVNQVHVLTATDLATSVPVLDSPTIGQVHVLTSADLSSGTPVLDQPALTQSHAIAVTDLSSGAPTLDSPTLTQVHVLAGSDLATPAPVLDSPTVTQQHTLNASDLTTPAPTLSSPSLSASHVLSPNDLITPAPTLSAGTIAQVHVFAATDLATANPTLDMPVITQVHALTGNDVSTTPVLDSATIAQIHALTANDLATLGPSLGSPTLTQVHVLTANDLATPSPVLDQATVAEEGGLIGNDVSAGVPVLDSPSLTQVHVLAPNDLTTPAPVLDQSAISQQHLIAVNDLLSGLPTLDTPTIAQVHALAPDDLTSGLVQLDTPAVSQVHVLTSVDLDTGAPTLDTSLLSQQHVLTVNDLLAGVPLLGKPVIDFDAVFTPSIRVVTVGAENRSVTVALEDRIVEVAVEDRGATVAAEDRTVTVVAPT